MIFMSEPAWILRVVQTMLAALVDVADAQTYEELVAAREQAKAVLVDARGERR